ncbi:phosphatase PAP2 family protein [Parabacteroides sp. AM08-6]|uniref:phosphatase PAP2 family protein n=1 Tax=Parabacteroides sp. AM08-6 TaxID=2292053 RepID=UPI001F427EF6|nr:phosphatase PAP2 family protein [Parabacteroides sp. AM08-6]
MVLYKIKNHCVLCNLLIAILLMSFCADSNAQKDTINISYYNFNKHSKCNFVSSKAFQITGIGVPLVTVGFLAKASDKHFRELRNTFIPDYHWKYDDYLQYLPAFAMVGMKIGGVDSRSSWGRMLVSDAFSVALMASIVNGVKFTAKVKRPDGSNRRSFPSGHSATAFMTATMMHKEYGGRSPWYSIGAYTVATATGVSRMMNNRHWLSDVMVGAGIGILTTELGYYLADLIFKEKGIRSFGESEPFERLYRPSFVGLYMGVNLPVGSNRLSDGRKLSLSAGSSAGFEGAYFLTPYVGIGGRALVACMQPSVDDVETTDAVEIVSAYAGPYFSYPLAARWLTGAKALVGYAYYPEYASSDLLIGETGNFSLSTGLSITYLAKRNFGMKAYVDYVMLPSMVKGGGGVLNLFTVGGAMNIQF